MYRSSKSRFLTFLPGDLRWPWPVSLFTKHRKWYLQMSVTLSMPIHWFCLRFTSKFYSPMSLSPESRKFLLWPDLWRHQWPPGQIFWPCSGSSRTGLSNGIWNVEICTIVWEILIPNPLRHKGGGGWCTPTPLRGVHHPPASCKKLYLSFEQF